MTRRDDDEDWFFIDWPSWLMIAFGAMLWLLACGILVGLMGWLK